jgi:hypothetical protein
MLWLDNAAV